MDPRLWYLCQPCDHRLWQHRNPNATMGTIGLGLMLVGAANIGIGLAYLT